MWVWYVVYTVFLAVTYLACLGGGAAMAFFADKDEQRFQGIVLAIVGLPFLIVYGAAPFLPKKPWAWIVHLILICMTMSSACCIPAAIPLLIFWLKPECKAYFGRA